MKLEQMLQELRGLSSEATIGPWKFYPMGDPRTTNQNRNRTEIWSKAIPGTRHDLTIVEMALSSDMDKDAAFISRSRTALPLLVEMLEVAIGALEHIKEGCLVLPDGGSPRPEDAIEAAHDAISAIEKLAEKGSV